MQQGATGSTLVLRSQAVVRSTGRSRTTPHWPSMFSSGRWQQAGGSTGGLRTPAAVVAPGQSGSACAPSLDQAIADEVAAVATSPAAEGILLYIDVPYCAPLAISLKGVMRYPRSTIAAVVLDAVKTSKNWAARRLAWCSVVR